MKRARVLVIGEVGGELLFRRSAKELYHDDFVIGIVSERDIFRFHGFEAAGINNLLDCRTRWIAERDEPPAADYPVEMPVVPGSAALAWRRARI